LKKKFGGKIGAWPSAKSKLSRLFLRLLLLLSLYSSLSRAFTLLFYFYQGDQMNRRKRANNFLSELIHNLHLGKEWPKIFAYFYNFYKSAQGNDRPLAENSPNPVTLNFSTSIFSFLSSFAFTLSFRHPTLSTKKLPLKNLKC
jgi:hypothetical protein